MSLTYLFDDMNQPEFQVRVKWHEGALTMWNNDCVDHYAVWHYSAEYRFITPRDCYQ